jgi:predicted DNA-binding transcriptional regulator AlpA
MTAPKPRNWHGQRLLSRTEAAAYVNVSPSTFDKAVTRGTMPQPKLFEGRVVWDLTALDRAIDDLPEREPKNEWDEDLGYDNDQAPLRSDLS